MPATDFARGDLTQYLLNKIRTEFICGDAEAPEEGGWDAAPTKSGSSYVGYCVLTPMPASDNSGPLANTSADWVLPYRIDSYGISREQTEFIADRTRALLRPVKRETTTIGGASYRIQQVRTDSLGGIGRSDGSEPSEFSQSDMIAVHVSKEMS